MEEGAGREPVGGGRRGYRCIIYIYIGGRDRAGAGRRGKTESITFHLKSVCTYEPCMILSIKYFM